MTEQPAGQSLVDLTARYTRDLGQWQTTAVVQDRVYGTNGTAELQVRRDGRVTILTSDTPPPVAVADTGLALVVAENDDNTPLLYAVPPVNLNGGQQPQQPSPTGTTP